MRISGLVLASILLISQSFAQRSSGGASSAGSYHGSYSGGSSSAGASRATSVGSSRSGSSSSEAARAGSNQRARSLNGSANDTKTAKAPDHSLLSLFHHKKPAPEPAQVSQRMFIPRCRRGQNCGICPGGSRNAFGQCVYPTQGCVAGQVWNGLGCGSAYYLSSCSNLAQQLASMDRWQNQRDPSWAWRRKLLSDQYQQCLMRYGANPFSLYALNGLGLFDVP